MIPTMMRSMAIALLSPTFSTVRMGAIDAELEFGADLASDTEHTGSSRDDQVPLVATSNTAASSEALDSMLVPSDISVDVTALDKTGELFQVAVECDYKKSTKTWFTCIRGFVIEACKENGMADTEDEVEMRLRIGTTHIPETLPQARLAKMLLAGAKGNIVGVTAFVEISSDNQFDAGMIAYLRQIRKQSPSDYQNIVSTLKDQHIFRKRQLDQFQLPSEASPFVQDLSHQVVQEVEVEEFEVATTKKREKKQLLDKETDTMAALMAEVVKQRDAAAQRVKNLSTTADDKTKEEAKNLLTKINEKLAKLQLEEADLSTNVLEPASSRLHTEGNGGGKIDGTTLGIESLMRSLSLDRGILIDSHMFEVAMPRKVVFELNKKFKDRSAEYGPIMEERMLMSVNQASKQWSVESSLAQQVQQAKQQVTLLGESSTTSSFMSATLGLAAPGFGFAGSVNGEAAASTTENTEREAQHKSSEKVSEWYKLTEFFEPRGLLHLEMHALKLAEEAHDAFLRLFTNDVDEERMKNTLVDFGSHFCFHTILGGRWEIFATAQSDGSTTAAEMSSATSRATDSTITRAAGIKAAGLVSGGVGDGEVSHAYTTSNGGQSGTAKKDMQEDAFTSKHTEVRQEWLGGKPGLTVGEWRESLNSNSNWRVIDREIDSCIGIWDLLHLANEPRTNYTLGNLSKVSYALCDTWAQHFMKVSDTKWATTFCRKKYHTDGWHIPTCKEFQCPHGYENDPLHENEKLQSQDNCCKQVGTVTFVPTVLQKRINNKENRPHKCYECGCTPFQSKEACVSLSVAASIGFATCTGPWTACTEIKWDAKYNACKMISKKGGFNAEGRHYWAPVPFGQEQPICLCPQNQTLLGRNCKARVSKSAHAL